MYFLISPKSSIGVQLGVDLVTTNSMAYEVLVTGASFLYVHTAGTWDQVASERTKGSTHQNI